MPWGLHRYYGTGHLHFITFSCYHRLPFLGTVRRRNLFLEIFEQVRERYRFVVVGYVVMPEHVHLLISERERGTQSTVMQVLKQRFARRVLTELRRRRRPEQGRLWEEALDAGHVWQARFYGQPPESLTIVRCASATSRGREHFAGAIYYPSLV